MKMKSLLFKVWISVFLFAGLQAFGSVFYLPHIHATSDAWETYLIVDPVPYGPAYYELTLFDDDGNVVSTQTGQIPEKQELRISLRQYGGTSGIFKTKIYPVRVRLGYVAKEDLGGGTAEFSLPTKLSQQAIMTLSNYYGQLNWSGFALFNGSDHDISVTAYGYKDGNQIFSKSFSMNAHSKVVDFFDNFFGLNSFSDIDTVMFQSDYPALTGIVISGKDNDKLLFSPTFDTIPTQSIYNEEYFDGFFYQKGLTYVNGHYYTFVSHGGKYYLRKTHSDNDSKFGMYELEPNVFAYNIIPSSDGENLIILGWGENSKYVVAKVSPTGETIWETEVGTYDNSLFAEIDKNNIVGMAANDRVVVAFHDNDLNNGVIKTIDDNNGSILSSYTSLSGTGKFYKAFIYSGYIGFAWIYTYQTKYMLQFLFVDTNGNIIKKIFGESPKNPDTSNVFFDTFGQGDYIYSVFGVKISDGGINNILLSYQDYSVYAMAIPFADSDFSNATIVSLTSTYLPSGSTVYSGFSTSFDSANYNTTWVIMTSPYYNNMNSKKVLIKITDNLPTGIYKSNDMPYKVTGAVDIWGMFLITGQQNEYVDTSTTRTKFIEKTLIGNNILNY